MKGLREEEKFGVTIPPNGRLTKSPMAVWKTRKRHDVKVNNRFNPAFPWVGLTCFMPLADGNELQAFLATEFDDSILPACHPLLVGSLASAACEHARENPVSSSFPFCPNSFMLVGRREVCLIFHGPFIGHQRRLTGLSRTILSNNNTKTTPRVLCLHPPRHPHSDCQGPTGTGNPLPSAKTLPRTKMGPIQILNNIALTPKICVISFIPG